MAGRPRTVPNSMLAPTHGGVEKVCATMTETAVHTVELEEGHFALLVLSRPDQPIGVMSFFDRDEIEALVVLLLNAIADAERLDRGLEPIHAAPNLTRN